MLHAVLCEYINSSHLIRYPQYQSCLRHARIWGRGGGCRSSTNIKNLTTLKLQHINKCCRNQKMKVNEMTIRIGVKHRCHGSSPWTHHHNSSFVSLSPSSPFDFFLFFFFEVFSLVSTFSLSPLGSYFSVKHFLSSLWRTRLAHR